MILYFVKLNPVYIFEDSEPKNVDIRHEEQLISELKRNRGGSIDQNLWPPTLCRMKSNNFDHYRVITERTFIGY